jgi:cytidyltransferase-like protein
MRHAANICKIPASKCCIVPMKVVSRVTKAFLRPSRTFSAIPTATASGATSVHRKALYAGTFDPPSCGHLDIISRALNLCDNLVIAVAINPSKKPMFLVEERVDLIRRMVKEEFPTRSNDVDVCE